MKSYDVVVIGFGKGGKTLAGKFAAEGKQVALIEKDPNMYGGTCINVGCIPSKSLVTSSRKAMEYGFDNFQEQSDYYKKAILEKRRVTSMLRGKNYDKLDQLEKMDIYLGEASFINEHEIAVKGPAVDEILRGEIILINTGSTPVILPIPGIDNNPYVYTGAELMDLDQLPKRLLIIGGGYIGLEFASIYSGFGSQVTILQDGAQLIPREDRDVAEAIQKALEDKGVTFLLGSKIQRVEQADNHAAIYFNREGAEQVLEGDAILLATGRRPNTDGLNLAKAGIAVSKRGAVEVNSTLQSSMAHIYAMGDVNGGLQFTYVSLDDSRIVWDHIHGGERSRNTRKNVPYSVFLTPPFSRVGLNEQEASEAGYFFRVAKMPTAAVPKAQVLGSTQGFLKVLIDRETDKILGAMLLCEESYEMINLVKLAMDLDAPYQVLRDQIYTHPTMSEALNDLLA